MSSTISTVITARVPNEQADAVRQIAEEYGTTVTAAVRVLLNHSLRDLQGDAMADRDDPEVNVLELPEDELFCGRR